MDDVVSLIVSDPNRGEVAFLTWGRVYHAVDPEPLIRAIRRILPAMAFSPDAGIKVCETLAEVREFKYFFEGLLSFAAQLTSEPIRDASWRKRHANDAALRKSLYLLGERAAVESVGN